MDLPYQLEVLLVLGGTALLTFLIKWLNTTELNLPYPPGPKGYPIIGSLFEMPLHRAWLGYDQWIKEYGGWAFFKILGQPILILGDLSKTTDLFETRSSIYSSRTESTMISELMSSEYLFSLQSYGPQWRQRRRFFHAHFHPNTVTKYQNKQMKGAHKFLLRLLENPDKLKENITHAFTSTIMDIVYGKELMKHGDPYLENVEITAEGILEAAVPGQFLVDLIPALKYVPSWVPGAGFKKKAAKWSKANIELLNDPWDESKIKLDNNLLKDCMAKDLMDALSSNRLDDEPTAKDVCATAALGGADTTTSSLLSFFLAMALYPESQKKAQAELDAVVGRSRLPNFDDRDALPYVNAIFKETLRWQNVGPIGVPHLSVRDDVYKGYFIPKGTIVIGNVWSFMHDPTVFQEPLEFIPERYLKDGKLDPTVRDPKRAAFGFGRRACPGRNFADQSLWCFISTVLAVFDIQARKDGEGTLINIRSEMTSGLISYPVPFDCNIKPRCPVAEALIQETLI